MPKGYWIINADIFNMEELWRYRAANRVIMTKYNAQFLVMHGAQHVVEGTVRAKSIVVEFPSFADAVACYETSEYQEAAKIRIAVSESNMVIVEGYEGPQGMDL